ncbi:hypothetical protein M406DRAFT_67459 [Cryphonectria parasitica EP155]|uniref:Uncharacterized protein n=1 Tax=Cryphonectria parasitica (strain ATCC 38755 / EP155) TaxID=660469 RepID=A0A9P4YDN9_CRYP1|nr:uncharacterized protein M406DRAFT_67459 [Cryphonectria parasitica EP155]KAF3771128.1 hypothetical protein M406DRAFT_67459 [Cryphonectria parasitica EP155]
MLFNHFKKRSSIAESTTTADPPGSETASTEHSVATSHATSSSSRLRRVSVATLRNLSIAHSRLATATSKSSLRRTKPRDHGGGSSSSGSKQAKGRLGGLSDDNVASSNDDSTNNNNNNNNNNATGRLPAFQVSQRAYLASLASLFSRGHGNEHGSSDYRSSDEIHSPVSAHNTFMTTDFSTAASPPGQTEKEEENPQTHEIDSPTIYQFSSTTKTPGGDLYVGRPHLVQPSRTALLEFEMATLPLLERDLYEMGRHLGQQAIRLTYELRMSGYAADHTVNLFPTVWILYRRPDHMSSERTDKSVEELQKAVSRLSYLQRVPEIQEGGGNYEPNSSEQSHIDVKPDRRESIKLPHAAALSVHVENYQGNPYFCGALCCVTTEKGSKKQTQSLCRVGGLLKINGKYVLGVTTAHAMLDGSGVFGDPFDDETGGSESTSLSNADETEKSIKEEASRVSNWQNVTRDAAVDFLGISMNSRGEMANNHAKPDNATDFALLRLGKLPSRARNQYVLPDSEEVVNITSAASASALASDEGPVHVLCGRDAIVDGQLIRGTACFVVRGRHFRVRRIQFSAPLEEMGGSAGMAGAWVVRGEVLYGILLAVYGNEPYAVMMTVDRLFESILGSAFSIRSVELWDGEASGLYEDARHAAAAVGRSSTTTPPPSRTRSHHDDDQAAAAVENGTHTDGAVVHREATAEKTGESVSSTRPQRLSFKAHTPSLSKISEVTMSGAVPSSNSASSTKMETSHVDGDDSASDSEYLTP